MKRKRICAALLCAVLSLGLSVPCVAAAAPEPLVTAEVRKITGGGTVEVSLKANVLTQSIQGVLTYDSTLLQPIAWDGTAISVTETWGPLGTLSHEMAAGKPALIKQTATAGYLYLAAETILGNTLPADKNLVTVRFKCLGATPDQAAAAASVKFATDATIAADTPAHDPAVLIDGLGEVKVIANPEISVTAGPSAGGGQTGATGEHAIVFFDWDGSVLSAIAAPQDAASAVAAEEAKLTALTEKAGYAFQGWVLSDGSRTAYNPGETLPAFFDFGNVTQASLLVQAVYQGTNELRVKADTSKSSDYVLDKANIYYTRYGAATDKDGKYSIKVSFDRSFMESGTKIGVERATTPGALVGMSPANTSLATLYSFLGGENGERITFEIVPTRDMSAISVYMVDVYGVAAWPNAGSRSGAAYTIKAADFIKYGTANYICEQGILFLENSDQSEWDKYVDAQAFKDAKGGVAVTNVDAAKEAVKSELTRIHTSEGQYRVLTYAEFTAAVAGK